MHEQLQFIVVTLLELFLLVSQLLQRKQHICCLCCIETVFPPSQAPFKAAVSGNCGNKRNCKNNDCYRTGFLITCLPLVGQTGNPVGQLKQTHQCFERVTVGAFTHAVFSEKKKSYFFLEIIVHPLAFFYGQ